VGQDGILPQIAGQDGILPQIANLPHFNIT
jgi:hypothetical protein